MASECHNVLDFEEEDGLHVGELRSYLEALECPFTWDLPKEESDYVFRKVTAKYEHERENGIIHIVHFLTLCGECVRRQDIEKASEILHALERGLENGNVKESLVKCNAIGGKEIYQSDAFRYLLLACKSFLLFYSKQYGNAQKILHDITPFKTMSQNDQSVLFCIKGSVLIEYGYNGLKPAVHLAEMAFEMSPELVLVHYQLGRLLGRLRRTENSLSFTDFREISCLEYTVEKTKNEGVMSMLAESYREWGRAILFENKNNEVDKQMVDELNFKASKLYREVMKAPERDTTMNFRCARGFMKLPETFQDLDMAKKCLFEALEKDPDNSSLNHVTGTYFFKRGDLEQAKLYLYRATEGLTSNYGACQELIFIKQGEDENYNPVSDWVKLLTHFNKEQPRMEDLKCNIGAYYYLKENDFKRAFQYWSEIVNQNIKSRKLKNLSHRIRNIKEKNMNISKIIVCEISKQDTCSEEEKNVYEKLLTVYPELENGTFRKMHHKSYSWSTAKKEDQSWRKASATRGSNWRDDNRSESKNWRNSSAGDSHSTTFKSAHVQDLEFGRSMNNRERMSWRSECSRSNALQLSGNETSFSKLRQDSTTSKSDSWRSDLTLDTNSCEDLPRNKHNSQSHQEPSDRERVGSVRWRKKPTVCHNREYFLGQGDWRSRPDIKTESNGQQLATLVEKCSSKERKVLEKESAVRGSK